MGEACAVCAYTTQYVLLARFVDATHGARTPTEILAEILAEIQTEVHTKIVEFSRRRGGGGLWLSTVGSVPTALAWFVQLRTIAPSNAGEADNEPRTVSGARTCAATNIIEECIGRTLLSYYFHWWCEHHALPKVTSTRSISPVP